MIMNLIKRSAITISVWTIAFLLQSNLFHIENDSHLMALGGFIAISLALINGDFK